MKNREVTVEDGEIYSYDYLVIGTGCEGHKEEVKGLSKDFNTFYTSLEDTLKLKSLIEKFAKGRVVVLTVSMPIPCPGAPGKFTILLDDYLRYVRGVRENVQITFLWPIKSVGPPAYNAIITKLFKDRGIEDIREFKFSKVDEGRREVVSADGEGIKYDLLVTIPPHKGVKALIDSGITDENGWVPNDKYTLQYRRSPTESYDEVYAIGDAGSPQILKTGIGAHYQALIAAQNIINDVLGTDIKVPYRGETGCPLVSSSYTPYAKGEAYLASWLYNSPLKPFSPTKLGWFIYRTYYYIYWDSTVKALL
ncbi:TPA: NAD(P)/FAD-dependent oxidoreductase [Candidatus Bathyarchaeota archaeon]|nr:NAD(P)/FAD-dependent oxidoreductase [Candidatus Bathyarchaeota archaeon]